VTSNRSECVAGIPENYQIASLRHECREMPDRSLHDDVDALHGDAAARRGIAIDHQQAAAATRARGLRGIALDADFPRHHVLGNALPGIAVHHHPRPLVHSSAVVANVAVDLDDDGRGQARCNRMLPARIEHAPMQVGAIGSEPVQDRVELAQRCRRKIGARHQCRSHK
jgi:hypothetical protein